MRVSIRFVEFIYLDEKCLDKDGNVCVGCLGKFNICSDLPFDRCKQLKLKWCPGMFFRLQIFLKDS